MNYASLMLGGVLIFAVIYYLVYGRHLYKGPAIEPGRGQILIENGVDGSGEVIKEQPL
jgi:hypothetical protein